MSIKHYWRSDISIHPETDSLQVAGVLGGVVDFLVQVSLLLFVTILNFYNSLFKAFLANRIRLCFRTPYIAIICYLLAFLRFVCSIASSAVNIMLGSLPPKWFWLLYAKWIVSVIVDITITASLCYHLAKGRRSSKSRR